MLPWRTARRSGRAVDNATIVGRAVTADDWCALVISDELIEAGRYVCPRCGAFIEFWHGRDVAAFLRSIIQHHRDHAWADIESEILNGTG